MLILEGLRAPMDGEKAVPISLSAVAASGCVCAFLVSLTFSVANLLPMSTSCSVLWNVRVFLLPEKIEWNAG